MPIIISSGLPNGSIGIKEVALYYRFSIDGENWGNWFVYGENKTTNTYNWSFTAPNLAGYYEFYSIAVSTIGLIESKTPNAEANCSIFVDWDVNMDKIVNILDLICIGQHWGEDGEGYWENGDVNRDGIINFLDVILVGQHFS